jgi:hypothetical protein
LYVRISRNLDIRPTPVNNKHCNNEKMIGTYLGDSGGISSAIFFEPALENVMDSTQNKRNTMPIICFLINLSLYIRKKANDVVKGLNDVIDKHIAGLKLAFAAYFEINPKFIKPSKHRLPRNIKLKIVRKSNFPCSV